jgi:hypothetical protein
MLQENKGQKFPVYYIESSLCLQQQSWAIDTILL